MAERITREDALTREGFKHACHIMLYGDSSAKLFGKIPIKHIVLVRNSALTVTWATFFLPLFEECDYDRFQSRKFKNNE